MHQQQQQQPNKRSAGGAPGAQFAQPAPGYNNTHAFNNAEDGAFQQPAYDNGVGGTAAAAAAGGPGAVDAGGGGSSPYGAFAAAGPNGEPVPCACGEPAVRRVSNSAANPGRPFFKCAKGMGQQCKFFKWVGLAGWWGVWRGRRAWGVGGGL